MGTPQKICTAIWILIICSMGACNGIDSKKPPSSQQRPQITIIADPPAGTYNSWISISLTAPGHELFYSDDPSRSEDDFLPYKQPILIKESVDLLVFGKRGSETSAVKTITYIIDRLPPELFIYPPSGEFSGPITVTILTDDKESKIFYSLDPAAPIDNFQQYGGAIQIGSSAEIRYFGVDALNNRSPIQTANYVIVIDDIPPLPAQDLQWAESSPFSGLAVTARWSKSNSDELSTQRIQLFSDPACSIPVGTSILKDRLAQSAQVQVEDGKTYAFKVSSFDASNNFSDSACSNSVTIDTIPPLPATVVRWDEVSPSRSTTATARWTLSSSADLHSQAVWLFATGDCSGNYSSRILSSSDVEASFSNLASAAYSFIIRSFDQAGNVSNSPCSSSLIIDVIPPSQATNLKWLGPNPAPTTTITADWDPGSGDVAAQILWMYPTGTCIAGPTSPGRFDLPAATRSLTFTGTINETYSFRVESRDAAGNESISSCSPAIQIIEVSLPDPTEVSGVSFGTTIQLRWKSGGGATSDFRIAYQAGSVAPNSCSEGTSISELDIDEALAAHDVEVAEESVFSFRICAIDNGVSPKISGGITVSVKSGVSPNMTVDGMVNTIAIHPDGDLLIGGEFSNYNSVWAPRIAVLQLSGSPDPAFRSLEGFDGAVLAIAGLSNGGFLVGGEFTHYRGMTANHIAKLTSNGLLDTEFSPQAGPNGTENTVNAIAVLGSDFYLGGKFISYRSQRALRIAKVKSDGDLDPEFNPEEGLNGTNSEVNAITVDALGTAIFIGGSFTAYRDVPAGRIAKVFPSGAGDPGFCRNSAFNASVYTIAVYDKDALYVGGTFTTYGIQAANRIAKLNASGDLDTTFSEQNTGENNGFNWYVYAITFYGTSVIVGGQFATYKGKPANNLAKLSAIDGGLDTNFNPPALNGTNGLIRALRVVGDNVFIAGNFTKYRDNRAVRIASINIANGAQNQINTSAGAAGFGGEVRALYYSGGRLYVGGNFLAYSGKPANNILKIGSSGVPDVTFNPESAPNGTDGPVYAIGTLSNQIFIGGAFSTYRGVSANNLAKLDLNGSKASTFFSNGTDGPVRAIAIAGEYNIYVGGNFTKYLRYDNAVVNNLFKMDNNGNLDPTFSLPTGDRGTSGPVYAVAWAGPDIYLGGAFRTYRGKVVNNIARIRYDGVLDDVIFSPQNGSNGTDGLVSAIVATGLSSDPEIYFGGNFTHFRDVSTGYVAKVDKSGSLISGFNSGTSNGCNGPVTAISVFEDLVYLGGSFSQYRGESANNLALATSSGEINKGFDPPSGIGGFDRGPIKSIIGSSAAGEIYIGGEFLRYRGGVTPFFAKLSSLNGNQGW